MVLLVNFDNPVSAKTWLGGFSLWPREDALVLGQTDHTKGVAVYVARAPQDPAEAADDVRTLDQIRLTGRKVAVLELEEFYPTARLEEEADDELIRLVRRHRKPKENLLLENVLDFRRKCMDYLVTQVTITTQGAGACTTGSSGPSTTARSAAKAPPSAG